MADAEHPAARAREPAVTAATKPRTFTLEMPAGTTLLNANDRKHWGSRHAITGNLRETAGWLARAAKIPALDRVRIVVEYQPPDSTRRRDAGNWAPSGKACIDGLRDAGVLADDDSARLVAEEYRIGEPCPRGRLVLHITEVPEACDDPV